MRGGECTSGHRLRSKHGRTRMTFSRRLKMKNRRLVEIIKHERIERAALHEKIRQHEEAATRYTCEIAGLKAQLVAVKAALNETNSILDEGINSFQLAKLRCHELNETIAEETNTSKPMEQGNECIPNNCQATASSTSSNSNHVLNPPPKLQARVNPMVQGVQLMSPSIMLQRLQPDDLERQLNLAPRTSTPAFNNLGQAR